jgi:sialate O-acetylesterase
VEVKLGPYGATGLSNADGKFSVRLPPMPAGGPFKLEVSEPESGESVASTDVMVGEVWLASGQSNMEWTVEQLGPAGMKAVEEPDDPLLRMFTVPRNAVLGGRAEAPSAWQRLQHPASRGFSAVACFFAKRLREDLGVTVGILNASWGGTPIETWIGRNWLNRNPFTKPMLARYEDNINSSAYWSGLGTFLKNVFPADPGNTGERDGWAVSDAAAEEEEEEWREAEMPNPWLAFGHAGSGVFWFRKTVTIPAAWAGRELSLQLGALDKQDITYFNGVRVGSTGKGFEEDHWNTLRHYRIPGDLVKPGPTTIAVRVYSFVYQGGMIGPAEAMKLCPADAPADAVPLTGTWRYRMDHDLGVVTPPAPPFGPGNPNTPHILFDSMIGPLVPCALRGAIWYQGESNADNADAYKTLLTDLIRNWRADWGQGDFPFLIVQLANFRAPAAYQHESTWARLREAQLQTLAEPGTGLAVTIDIGEAANVHPGNKQDVGERLARWALAQTYAKPIVSSGPLYRSMTIEGANIRLHFDHAAGGLAVKGGGSLKTFVIAGPDRRFHPAEAIIKGETIVVSSLHVRDPLAVRYAWADNPDGCNFMNGAGLPASPFRTDCWP